NKILPPTIAYEVVSDKIVLKYIGIPKAENSVRAGDKDNAFSTVPNDIVVRGRVSDNKGETLPGVSIRVKGTATGTTSDLDGNYLINVPDGNGTLVFTYIGYVTQEIEIN